MVHIVGEHRIFCGDGGCVTLRIRGERRRDDVHDRERYVLRCAGLSSGVHQRAND